MSSQNIEAVRAIYDALNDPARPFRALDLIDERAEFVNPDHAIEPGVRYGHEGFSEVLAGLDGAFEKHGHEVERLVDLGRDRVFAFTTFRARGRGSGVEVEVSEQHLWTFNAGKVVRYEWFHDESQALEAAGISV